MAKIGTAHIEVKPVLNEDALDQITKRIEDAIAAGVQRGLEQRQRSVTLNLSGNGSFEHWVNDRPTP